MNFSKAFHDSLAFRRVYYKEQIRKMAEVACVSETTVNASELLSALYLNSFNRWAIIGRTLGALADDEILVQIKGKI